MSQAEIVDPQKMVLKYRIQEQEMRNLKSSLTFLTEKNRSISIDPETEQSYQSFVDSFPDINKERDILLENLEELAERKFEESNQTDMTANLCLYLIKRLRQTEELNLELENQYIDRVYDPNFLSVPLKSDDEGELLPSKLKKLKPKYKSLKSDLLKIEEIIEDTHSALQLTRSELNSMRKSHSKSIKSLPETMRDLNFTKNNLEKEIQMIEKNIEKEQEKLSRKNSKFSNRIQLITVLISELRLRTVTTDQGLPDKARILNELKLILENIISENYSLKFVRSRIILLLRALKNDDFRASTEQTQTPQPIKTTKPLIPMQINNRMQMMGSSTPASTNRETPNSTPQSFEDLRRKFKLLQQQVNSTPDFSSKHFSVKSPD